MDGLASCETMRDTVAMPPARKTPQAETAGRIIRDLRKHTLGFASQKDYARHIGASPRQVAAAELGEHVGDTTRERIEDGFGWPRGSFQRLLDTGEHPPVTADISRMDEAGDEVPELVRMSRAELVRATVALIEADPEHDEVKAARFLLNAARFRAEWNKRSRSDIDVTVEEADEQAG
jgi:hypothetical protein